MSTVDVHEQLSFARVFLMDNLSDLSRVFPRGAIVGVSPNDLCFAGL